MPDFSIWFKLCRHGALAFEDADTKAHLAPGRDLGDAMARLGMPLVILEACRSSGLSDRPVSGSVAPALLQSGVGSVVAFSHSVRDEAVRILVERFYRELCKGPTVGQALEEARTLASPHVSKIVKAKLHLTYKQLDVVELKRKIDRLVDQLWADEHRS